MDFSIHWCLHYCFISDLLAFSTCLWCSARHAGRSIRRKLAPVRHETPNMQHMSNTKAIVRHLRQNEQHAVTQSSPLQCMGHIWWIIHLCIYIYDLVSGADFGHVYVHVCVYIGNIRDQGLLVFWQIHGFQLLRTPHTYPPFKGDGVWGTKMGFIYGALCPLVVPSGSFQKDRVLHFHRRLVQQQRLFRMHEPEQTGALNLLLNDRRHCQALDGLLFMCTLGDYRL